VLNTTYTAGSIDNSNGSVTLTLTPDASGVCPVIPSELTITVNPTIFINPSITHVTCNGLSNGAIDFTATGGNPPFSYNWSGPGGFSSTSEDLTGLVAGTY